MQVGFGQGLALGIRGLRVDRRALVDLTVSDAIDRTTAHVDEAPDAGLLGDVGHVRRTLVVDVVGDRADQVAGRVVGQLGHGDDRVHPVQVCRGQVTHVLDQGPWTRG